MGFLDQLFYMHGFFMKSIGTKYTIALELGIVVVFIIVLSLMFLQLMKE